MPIHRIELTFEINCQSLLVALLELRKVMRHVPEDYLQCFDLKLSTDNAQAVRHADE